MRRPVLKVICSPHDYIKKQIDQLKNNNSNHIKNIKNRVLAQLTNA